MGKIIKLRKQLKDILYDKYKKGYGTPKHAIKDVHNSTPYIHSKSTYNTYMKQTEAFCTWCQDQGIKTPQDARESVKHYLEYLEQKKEDMSACTVKTAGAALAKVFECSINDFGYAYPKKERSAIKRSRYAAERDKHVSLAHNEELIEFCKSTGLRRCEVEKIRGRHHHKGEVFDTIVEHDGKYYVCVVGKGGKKREAEILGTTKQIKRVVNRIKSAGDGLVWQHVHTKLDIHALRAGYAAAMYHKYERPVEDWKKGEVYYCKNDLKGVKYDKKAIKVASQNLGHEREVVIALSYSWQM